MQEPIISPWLIYLANVPQALAFVLMVTTFACAVIVGVAVFFRCVAKDEAKTLKDRVYRYSCQEVKEKTMVEINGYEADVKKFEKIAIVASVVAVVLLTIYAFIPSKETCYQMIAAHYLTYENVDAVGGQAKEMIDYVLDRMDEIANGGA